jgi:polysaccharide biosynthesis protein PslG
MSAHAAVPQLLGAQTHPFWSDTNTTDFDHELDLLTQAGADSVRVDIAWSSLELNAKGSYDSTYVAKIDRFMTDAAARNIKVIGTVYTTPCWASSAPATVKQSCSGSWWDRGVQYYPPTDPNDYADAAAWIAQRWGSKMAALEVWNEPNQSNSFNSANPAADYAAILKAAYPRIKLVAPTLPVLGPAMAYSDGNFLEALYAQGIQGFFDGLSFHPYNEWRAPSDPWQDQYKEWTYITGVPWIRSIETAHGDLKPLWFTEFGWSSCLPGGTDKWCVTTDEQAQYIPDALRIIRDNWDYVQAAIVYNLRNKGTTLTDRESSFGMVYRDFTPKPSYGAWKNVLSELRGTALNLSPTVALTSPLPGSTFTSNVCMSAAASDDHAVTKVTFSVDGKLVATDTSAPYSYVWTASKNTTYKQHTVLATAYDASGLTAKSSATITRVKGAPSCQLASAASLRNRMLHRRAQRHHARRHHRHLA